MKLFSTLFTFLCSMFMVASGSVYAVIPDIKINNSDTPITVTTNDTLAVTAAINPGNYANINADWWAAYYNPSSGWFYYDLANGWINTGNSYSEISVSYQGPLFTLPTTTILNESGLAAGIYDFYLGVDMNVNGSLDINQFYYDSVTVEVKSPSFTNNTSVDSCNNTWKNTPSCNNSSAFCEGWENALMDSYSVESTLEPPLIAADAGDWLLGDTVSEFSDCGSTPHKAEIIEKCDSHALHLESNDSHSSCADNVWARLVDFSLFGPFDINKGFSIPIFSNTMISFKETGELINPQRLRGSIADLCLGPPCYDNISLLFEDNNGNQLAYVLQRAPNATSFTEVSYFSDYYREILLDSETEIYTRNIYDDFSLIPTFNPIGAQILSILLKIDEHGWAVIDDIVIK